MTRRRSVRPVPSARGPGFPRTVEAGTRSPHATRAGRVNASFAPLAAGGPSLYVASMGLGIPVVWDERHWLHRPDGEIWVGVRVPSADTAERINALRGALEAAGAGFHELSEHGDPPVRRIHDRVYLEFLAGAYDDWVTARLVDDPGQDRVVPYVFALPQMTSGRPAPVPAAPWARAGRFAFDTMTLIGPGTCTAARAAVDVALTAADLVLDGHRAAYAGCRPPGHHAGAALYGGGCYLNNAAVTAQWLRDHNSRTVAVIDLDGRHGNGTQEIFYERPDVYVASVHADPGQGCFPHFTGFYHERGAGPGEGFNRNIALAPGADDGPWVDAVTAIVREVRSFGPDALVVSLGVDAAADDPENPLAVTGAGFGEAARLLESLDLPTVFVQEGGFNPLSLGPHVVGVLRAFEEATAR